VLRARRTASPLPAGEAALLQQINQGLPEQVQRRYAALIDRRGQETLSTEEYEELLRLTAQVEEAESQRMQALAQLAQLRRQPLAAFFSEFHIARPAHG
jgi:hypothetical protein